MERKEVLDKLNEIFVDVFDDETIVITEETSQKEIEDWDSLMHVSLIMSVENEFHIKFTINEVTSIKNVGRMVDLILGKV